MTDATSDNAMGAGATGAGSEAPSGPMLAADGTPLKKSLARALRAQKLRALEFSLVSSSIFS